MKAYSIFHFDYISLNTKLKLIYSKSYFVLQICSEILLHYTFFFHLFLISNFSYLTYLNHLNEAFVR